MDFFLNGGQNGSPLIVQGSNDYRGIITGAFNGATGYYVNFDNTCVPNFEGALPLVTDPLTGGTLGGGGDPVVAADVNRNAFFMADSRFKVFGTTGVGVFRTTGANLLNVGTCPAGTHTPLQSAACWPTGKVLNPLPLAMTAYFNDKPHMTVDERASGTGAGDVYVTWTEFDFLNTFSRIELVACKNDLSVCSDPIIVSGSDLQTQFSHVSVRPDGRVTVTYINVTGAGAFFPVSPSLQGFDIKYVTCGQSGAPITPSCSPPTKIISETQPLPFGGFLAAQDFRISTYPKHDHQTNPNNSIETYVVWDRCKVPVIPTGPMGAMCPDADIKLAATSDDGASWGFENVIANPQDQFFVWIKTDRSQNVVNIAFYDASADPLYNHRVYVAMRHIIPGASTPNPINDYQIITTLLDDPAADPFLGGTFFGDYIGMAARGTGVAGQSRAYIGFTYNNFAGTYSGVSAAEQNNHISRFDY